MRLFFVLLVLSVGLIGCGPTWTQSNVTLASPSKTPVVKTDASHIDISETEPKRAYTTIGDIEVSVHKTTLFDPNPSRQHVNNALREKAAELGADAVIFVRYGEVGVSFSSWGTLDGRGRAVRFNE
jgi:hypothetical protein